LGKKYRELGRELERGAGITCDDMAGMYYFCLAANKMEMSVSIV
jgi:hypothetical protein